MEKSAKYAGVYIYTDGNNERIFYILYRQGRGRGAKLVKEPVGNASAGMTAAKAAQIRADRMRGKEQSNTEHRAAEIAARRADESRWPLGRIWQAYQDAHTESASRKIDCTRYNAHLKKRFGDMLPADITTADVERMKGALLKVGRKPATIQRIMVVLRAVINFGVQHGHCPPIDPGKLQFKAMKVDNQKTEVLTDAELVRLLQALDAEDDQNAAALIRLALVTGMRKGALLALRWDDCDFERGIITLRGEAAKKGKTDFIPMSTAARTVLEGIDNTGSPFVFPGRGGAQRTDYRRIARRVKAKAGLPEDFRPLHGLRHNYASRLASSGQVDMYTLQKLLTHESPTMTQRYAHLADEAMKRAAAVADSVLTPKAKE
ncbi:MAG: site-specific integrase [Desulfovibrionaceae bacterium]